MHNLGGMDQIGALRGQSLPRTPLRNRSSRSNSVTSAVIQMYDAMYRLPWSNIDAALRAFYTGLRGTETELVPIEDAVDFYPWL